jgi:hypothetical protein
MPDKDPPASLSPAGTVTVTIPLQVLVSVGAVSTTATTVASGIRPAGRPAAAPQPASGSSSDLITFRDHFNSLYQSIAERVARKQAGQGIPEATATPAGGDIIRAAQRVALRRSGGQAQSAPLSTAEAMPPTDRAELCADLAWQLLHAKVTGDTVTAGRIDGELNAGSCDPRWADTVTEYLKYFGPGGARRAPQYVTPADAGEVVLTIKPAATIGLIADWGTGAEPARKVLEELRAQRPDILIHLGDIYYSGTPDECRDKFEALVNAVFERPQSGIPVFTLCGNHDMYCGGVGYYDLIKRLNAGLSDAKGCSLVQPASFFCLRAEDDSWQILAMDTGQHDYNPFHVTTALTFVEQEEQEWLLRRMQGFPGSTILLSHHQLFSAFSQIGAPGVSGRLSAANPKLLDLYNALAASGRIVACFWGHEHNLCIYNSYASVERGRCMGHGAVPVFAADGPYDTLTNLDNPPSIIDGTELSVQGSVYAHGFAILKLGSGTASAEYFEDGGGVARSLYKEAF